MKNTNPSKLTYQFSGSTDRYRRFDRFAVHIGYTDSGKAVFAWRDAPWTISQHCAASTFYVITRVSINDVSRPHDTLAARNALAELLAVQS